MYDGWQADKEKKGHSGPSVPFSIKGHIMDGETSKEKAVML